MGEYVLEMKEVCKEFPGTKALNNVNFNLKSGEIHALIGENGAGKSTLMNVLMGVHQKNHGEIFLNGKKIENKSTYEALLKGIAMVPQELNLVGDVSIAENVFLGNEQKGKSSILIDWNKMNKRAAKFLKELGLEIDVTQNLKNISAAHQQLVSIARSLAFNSQILILDEPTASLTINETEVLFKALKRLRSEGKSIILITHHLNEVKDICDRTTIMRDGNVVYSDNTENLTIDDMIIKMANKKVQKSVASKRDVKKDVFFEVRNLSRNHEFHDISFSVYKGEIFGVAGLVGAGRTEVFRSIYGLTKKESGKVFLEGKEVKIGSPSDAIKLGIGYVPEERRKMGIFPILSVIENLLMPTYSKLSKCGLIDFNKARQTSAEYIKDLSIKTPSDETFIKNLSGGNQQKVILARWMAEQAKLMILDEPTRGIDVNAKADIYKLVTKLADSGVTVIVISSEIEELIANTDRMMVMHEGKLKGFIDNPRECAREDVLKLALQ